MATNLDIAQNFDELAYGNCDTDTGNHAAAVVIKLKPSSSQKAIIDAIHFGVKWTTVYTANGTTTEIKVAAGQVYVLEGNLDADDLKKVIALYSAGTTITKATLDASQLKLRYMYNYNDYNIVPLTNLNIKSSTNKTLYVMVNCPNLSANDTGSPVSINLSVVAFGRFEEQNADLKPVTYTH